MATETLGPQHAEINEELNAFLDGQVDAARRTEVEAHVLGCAVCTRELEQLRGTRAVLRAQTMLRAPRTFVVPLAEPETKGWQRILSWGWRLGTVAAAACVMIAALSAGAGPSAYTGGGQGTSASLSKGAPEGALEERAAMSARDSAANRGSAPAPAPAAAPAAAPNSGAASLGASSGSGTSADQTGSRAGPSGEAAVAPQVPDRASLERSSAGGGRAPRAAAWGGAGLLLGAASAAAFVLERRLRIA